MGKEKKHHHVHIETDDDKTENRIYNYLIKFKKEIMGALEDVKAALALSTEKLNVLAPLVTEISASVPAIAKDIAFIKAKLESNTGGINAAGVAEILAVVNSDTEKLTTITQAVSTANDELKALDAETDSNEEVPPVE